MLMYGCGIHIAEPGTADCHPACPVCTHRAGNSDPLTLLESAQVACKRWQRELRLEDWDVTIAIVRQKDLGDCTMGDCTRAKMKRIARIRLLDERDVDGQDMITPEAESRDWEMTLVHELLHLQLHDAFPRGYPDGGAEELAIERAIDATSKALVRLDRRVVR